MYSNASSSGKITPPKSPTDCHLSRLHHNTSTLSFLPVGRKRAMGAPLRSEKREYPPLVRSIMTPPPLDLLNASKRSNTGSIFFIQRPYLLQAHLGNR